MSVQLYSPGLMAEQLVTIADKLIISAVLIEIGNVSEFMVSKP